MDELHFKKAEKKDAAVLAGYRFKMFDEIYKDNRLASEKERFINKCEHYYLDRINEKNHYSIIALAGKNAAGCGTIILEERPPSLMHKSNLSAYILNIYVDKYYRGRGIARKIMEHLHEYARSMEVRKIGLHASQFGRGLYKKMGYRAKESYLEMEL
jgi:ribosomal protein S18 acetylase RimI-like enzyme